MRLFLTCHSDSPFCVHFRFFFISKLTDILYTACHFNKIFRALWPRVCDLYLFTINPNTGATYVARDRVRNSCFLVFSLSLLLRNNQCYSKYLSLILPVLISDSFVANYKVTDSYLDTRPASLTLQTSRVFSSLSLYIKS